MNCLSQVQNIIRKSNIPQRKKFYSVISPLKKEDWDSQITEYENNKEYYFSKHLIIMKENRQETEII